MYVCVCVCVCVCSCHFVFENISVSPLISIRMMHRPIQNGMIVYMLLSYASCLEYFCSPNPCRNGGTCMGSPGHTPAYTCQCDLGYDGTDCGKYQDELLLFNDINSFKTRHSSSHRILLLEYSIDILSTPIRKVMAY